MIGRLSSGSAENPNRGREAASKIKEGDMREARTFRTRRAHPAAILNALTLAASLWPISATAEDVFYVCKNGDATEYVRVNYAARSVSETIGDSPSRCILSFVDGRVGTVVSSPPDEECPEVALWDLTGGHQFTVEQYVHLSGHTVKWGAHGQPMDLDIALDTETGILDRGNAIEECHRPHA
jgi:hypothetical protein